MRGSPVRVAGGLAASVAVAAASADAHPKAGGSRDISAGDDQRRGSASPQARATAGMPAEPLTAFDLTAFLLMLAAVIGLVNDRWIGVPRNIALLIGALLVAGLAMAADLVRPDGPVLDQWRDRLHRAHLSTVLLDGVLALLLFASALHVNPRELRDHAWSVLMLSTLGVLLAALLFGAGLHALTWMAGYPIPLIWCLVLGAILAPTDPVVVQGLLRRARLPAELRGMIVGESLFNDGAAVVMVLACLAIASGAPDVLGHGRMLMHLAREVGGGILLGWGAGMLAVAAAGRPRDQTLDLILSLALALGTYRLAVALGVSGPITVVAAGLAWRHAPRNGRAHEDQTVVSWGVIDDLLNTGLFLLMGFHVLEVRPDRHGWIILPAVVGLAVLARAISVTLPVAATRMQARDKARSVCVLTWTGLRGGISIALALTLPETPWRDTLLALAYGVVIVSIIVQGLSVPSLLRLLYGAGWPPQARSSKRHNSDG